MGKDAPGMKGYRPRNEDGELRKKRNDTHVGTIEKTYGVDFDVRSDEHLGTLLKKENVSSLSQLVDKNSN
jgi:hypothetical protein